VNCVMCGDGVWDVTEWVSSPSSGDVVSVGGVL
jgi:hypothetical protein